MFHKSVKVEITPVLPKSQKTKSAKVFRPVPNLSQKSTIDIIGTQRLCTKKHQENTKIKPALKLLSGSTIENTRIKSAR